MCLRCAIGSDGHTLARRAHVLQILTLVEHHDALPAKAVLRLAQEVLALIQAERTERRCDPVAPSEPDRAEFR